MLLTLNFSRNFQDPQHIFQTVFVTEQRKTLLKHTTSGQEMERVYSYNLGAHTGPTFRNTLTEGIQSIMQICQI